MSARACEYVLCVHFLVYCCDFTYVCFVICAARWQLSSIINHHHNNNSNNVLIWDCSQFSSRTAVQFSSVHHMTYAVNKG